MIDYFLDAEDKHRFRVKGLNGEVVASSEPYYSQSNAERGVRGLYLILKADLGGEVAEEDIQRLLANTYPDPADTDGDGRDSGSGRSSDASQPSNPETVREAEEQAPLQEGTSAGITIPGQNNEDRPDDGH